MTTTLTHLPHNGELSVESAGLPELTEAQQQELESWVHIVNAYVRKSPHQGADQLVGDFVVHAGENQAGLITGARVYDEQDDRWLPQALGAVFPTYQVRTPVANGHSTTPDTQPAYVGIATSPEAVKATGHSHDMVHAMAAMALAVVHIHRTH